MLISYGPKWERAEQTIIEAISNYTDDTAGSAKWLGNSCRESLSLESSTLIHTYILLTKCLRACILGNVVRTCTQQTVKHQLQILVLTALS